MVGTTTPRTRWIGWADRDRFASLTFAAAFLLLGAVVLRVVGVPPIDVHGPLHYLGIMDPFCGGTRAMYLLSAGDFRRAATYNPIVFPLAAAIVLLVARAVIGWATHRWPKFTLSPTVRRVLLVALVIAVAALGVRQQLNAEMLMRSWP